jgi:hypothetical protein
LSEAYFEVLDDLEAPGRWHLNGLRDANARRLDEREFAIGRIIHEGPPLKLYLADEDTLIEVSEPLQISIRRRGMPLDFTFAGLGAVVVTPKAAAIIRKHAPSGIQWFPVRIDGQDELFEIMNVASTIDCMDLDRSEIEWWESGNEVRPDLAGTPRMVWKLAVDEKRTKGRNLLRPRGWERSLIVAERVREALEEGRVTGISFRVVSGEGKKQ